MTLPEIEYILNDFKPAIFFVGTEFMDMIPALKKAIPSITYIVPMEKEVGFDTHYKTWRESFGATPAGISRAPEDDTLQIYTSGTTGHPKGVRLSNRSLLTPYERFRHHPSPDWNIWSDDDVSLIPMPCFHIGGTAWGLTGMAHGATGVIMRNFTAAIQIVVNQPEVHDVDFSQLKFMFYGASPMPLPLLETAIDVFG